jgi:hypothetical protein
MVEVSIDSNGQVTSAEALSGHPLLRAASLAAARRARFEVNSDRDSRKIILIYRYKDEGGVQDPCCENYPFVISVVAERIYLDTTPSKT